MTWDPANIIDAVAAEMNNLWLSERKLTTDYDSGLMAFFS